MSSSRRLLVSVSSACLGALALFVAREADGSGSTGNTCTWTGPAGGVWSDPGNWVCTPGGSVPGAADTAVFPKGDAGASIGINGQQAVGSIDVTAGGSYTFAPVGDGGLTIGASATFATGNGVVDTFTAPIAIGSPVTFSTSPGSAAASVQVGPVAFSAGGSLTTQGQVFLANGPVTGPGAVVASAGTLYLQSPSNTYSGGTQVLSGNLLATNRGALGSGPVALGGTGRLSILSSGTVPNALSIGSAASPTLSVQPSDIAGVTWAGPVQVTSNARIEASNFVITGPLTGGGVLTFQSLGNWTQNGAPLPIELANANNPYAGATIVASGGGPGAAVLADYSGSFGGGPITIQGGGGTANSGVVALASGVALANPIDALGGLLLANGDASVTGPVTGTGVALGAGTNGATLTVAGTLGGSADSYGNGLYVYGSWVVSLGTGTVRLALPSPATYAGKTAIVSATLDLGDQPNPLPPGTQVLFTNPGSLSTPSVLAVHANAQIGGLDGCFDPSLITIDHGATLTIAMGNPAISTQCYTGPITGDGGLTFTGDGGNAFPGTSVDGGAALGGDFTYAYEGPTRIEGNPATLPTVLALDVTENGNFWNGSIPNSTITVAAGGELDLGPASVVGPVIGAGGTIVPYPGPATTPDAGAASLTLSADTKLRAVYAGPDAGTSFLAVNGAVSLGNATLVTTTTPALPPEGPVVVIANRGDAGVGGTFAGLPEGTIFSSSGGVLQISYTGGDGNDVTLEVPLADGGTEAGAPSDAGQDAIADAAPDSTVGASDAGLPDDDGGPLDAGPIDATPPDAGPIADGAPSLGDAALVAIAPPAGACGCTTAGGGGSSRGTLLGLTAIALAGLRRRRGRGVNRTNRAR